MAVANAGPAVRINCRCGKIDATVILETSISVPIDFCHCDICRWTTGNLFYSALPLQGRPNFVEQLTKYNSSEKVSRYFCSTCGSHVCHKVHKDHNWHVASGLVDINSADKQIWSHRGRQITKHQFVADTVDGGLALCLAGSEQFPTHFYMQAENEPAFDLLPQTLPLQFASGAEADERLRAACHCGGVEFYLSRPNEASRQSSSPWPDLLRPYYDNNSANPEDQKWWIRGSTKYLAGTCACNHCRLSNSNAITCWGFVPEVNLSTKDGSPLRSMRGTLQSYASSEGKIREFCSRCGASVFLRLDFRPELLDVSFGLFRAPEGARAESWFDWAKDRVSFVEDGIDKDLVVTCELGLKHLKTL